MVSIPYLVELPASACSWTLLPSTAPHVPGGSKSAEPRSSGQQVPEEAGPQEGDLSSVHYPYYSTIDYVTNQYSGLIGVVMITPPATLTAQGALQLWSFGCAAASPNQCLILCRRRRQFESVFDTLQTAVVTHCIIACK